MEGRKIVIFVPTDFEVPEIYRDGQPAEVAMALKLGAESVDIIQKRAIDVVRQETHAEVVKQATADIEHILADTRASTEAALAKSRQEKLRAEEALRAATMRVEAMEFSAAAQRAQIQKEVRESVHELLQAKDEQIQRLQQTMEKTVDGMGRRVESLQQSITKTFASSKEKGTLGEAIMERFMKLAYDCDIHVVSKGSETADIRMTRPGGAYF
jgi:uncharacterized protein YicC (UPF0701 family)